MTVLNLGSANPWEPIVGYSRIVVRGDTAWVSGTTAMVDGAVVHPGDAAAQEKDLVLLTPRKLGASLGTRPTDVVRTRMYVTDIGRWEKRKDLVPLPPRKLGPSLWTRPSALIDPELLVEIEADAVREPAA